MDIPPLKRLNVVNKSRCQLMERPENHHPKLRHHIHRTSISIIYHFPISPTFAMPLCHLRNGRHVNRFSRLFWIASATFSSALPRKWHSLQTLVGLKGGKVATSCLVEGGCFDTFELPNLEPLLFKLLFFIYIYIFIYRYM